MIGPLVPNWSPREYPDPRRVAAYVTAHSLSKQLVLEPLDAQRHGYALHEAFQSSGEEEYKSLFVYNDVGPFPSAEAYVAYLSTLTNKMDPMFFAICRRSSSSSAKGDMCSPVGIYSLLRTDRSNGVTEVGWVMFSPLLKRSRISTESIYLLMKYVFEELGYRRFEWKCHSLNEASCAAALRYGFIFEGIFRQSRVSKGRSRDTTWYSIVDMEYAALRPAFEGWLADDNFDSATGQQKLSLAQKRAKAGPLLSKL